MPGFQKKCFFAENKEDLKFSAKDRNTCYIDRDVKLFDKDFKAAIVEIATTGSYKHVKQIFIKRNAAKNRRDNVILFLY